MRKKLTVLAVVTSIFVLTACGGSHDNSATSVPASLIGEWRQINAKDVGVMMVASVKPGSIQIDMESRDSTSIYWLGTFDSDKNTAEEFEVVSQGDTDAMTLSIFGSQDKTKSFVYKDGEISYKFTMAGTTSTIRLAKK